ncbi:hypothetical protein L207DRAFT_511146 [Hyaloscypha variabilis F]|uniref:Protection of telomeres protein 1 n=1 Tax=Hyaloscypha variabilis (strain UAMH 11265 / GT02V1 / F) TaxID=1149755 RepID=A0A2J6RRS8_HYAVF|nr:hypothetical protein L207DRAFT_511146 [Hyaloscypha variabilis F]
MANAPTSSQDEVPLPNGFLSIEQIRDIDPFRLKAMPKVSVIGFVKDVQPPIKTAGTDFKFSIGIMDHSYREMKIDFFEKNLQNMPTLPNLGDLVIVRDIKAQMFRGNVSLLKHSSTEFRFLALKSIPKNVSGDSNLPWVWYPAGKGRSPSPAEMKYIFWMSNYVDRVDLPATQQFEERKIQALNSNDKFSLLKDVKPDRFYDILGQVIKLHDEHGVGHLTMYLSDYTYNTKFHNYVWGSGVDDQEARNGDEYGYIKPKSVKDWPGPFGKMTIQLTLFDEHAQFVRECMELGTWVRLRNVQIKYGKTGGVLEGYMRGFEEKLNVSIVKLPGIAKKDPADEESRDPRCKEIDDEHLKDAVQRKFDYLKKFEKSQEAILKENPDSGKKRKHGDEGLTKKNSKKRREEKRAAAFKNAAAADAKIMERLDLNQNIRCSYPEQPIVSFSEMLKARALGKNQDGQQKLSPFTCAKYRAAVKVVDFFPHKIQDFAVGRRPNEFDILSDHSGGEDTDREDDLRVFKSGKGFAKHIWEWRFALQVEDASSKESKERLWLLVDNHAAQGLLNFEDDATNLRQDPELLGLVKEQLFKLWGDLEELKSAKMEKDVPQSSLASDLPTSSPLRKAGAMPDADSDVENEPSQPKSKTNSKSSVLAERDSNTSKSQIASGKAEKSNANLAPKNKAFTCCIKQYGVKVDEEEPAKADAGNGKRWQRMFGLFGTSIV